jgi:hypothetical protein
MIRITTLKKKKKKKKPSYNMLYYKLSLLNSAIEMKVLIFSEIKRTHNIYDDYRMRNNNNKEEKEIED